VRLFKLSFKLRMAASETFLRLSKDKLIFKKQHTCRIQDGDFANRWDSSSLRLICWVLRQSYEHIYQSKSAIFSFRFTHNIWGWEIVKSQFFSSISPSFPLLHLRHHYSCKYKLAISLDEKHGIPWKIQA